MSKRTKVGSTNVPMPIAVAAAVGTSLKSQSKFHHERTSTDTELDQLKSHIHDLVSERASREREVAELADQDWQQLLRKCDQLHEQVDSLAADVRALRDHATRQKQVTYTPERSRAESHADASSAVSPTKLDPAKLTLPRGQIARKEFSWRDSPLTTFFRTSPEMKTIYNMWVAILILFALKIFVRDVIVANQHGAETVSILMFLRTFGKLTQVIPIWFLMAGFHALILPIMWIWRQRKISNLVYSLAYLLHQLVFFFGFAQIFVHLDLPVASSLILLCEQVRMLMKTHSFWRETLRIRQQPFDPENEETKNLAPHLSHSRINCTFLPTWKEQLDQFILFHFSPTLIYRNAYPRTRYIRWQFVAICFAEVCGCIFYIYVIFANLDVEFQNSAHHPGDLKELVVSLFNSVLPGIGVYLLTFFGLLHAWMNMFAELTQFADRTFYLDWWNTTSFSSYYRKWNMLVHDSLYNYIYVDLTKLGVPRGIGFFLTFLVSALVHEYIISFAMKFLYPVLFFMFLVFGVAFVYLTRFVGTSGRGWNTFFWANLIIGNGMLLIMYSREYYARQPQMPGAPPKWPFDTESWVPYSWQPFLPAFKTQTQALNLSATP